MRETSSRLLELLALLQAYAAAPMRMAG